MTTICKFHCTDNTDIPQVKKGMCLKPSIFLVLMFLPFFWCQWIEKTLRTSRMTIQQCSNNEGRASAAGRWRWEKVNRGSNWYYKYLRSIGQMCNHQGITQLCISILCKKNDDGCLFWTLMVLEKKKKSFPIYPLDKSLRYCNIVIPKNYDIH